MKVKSESEVAQLCPTLSDPMDCHLLNFKLFLYFSQFSNAELTKHWSSFVLEKEMATHSSVLAWRIPGTGEPGGLLSMGSHRVGHD